MNTTIQIPNYPPPKKVNIPITNAVQRSLAKPDAFAKPATIGKSGMRVRLTSGDKSLLPRKKKRHHDKRDVHFY